MNKSMSVTMLLPTLILSLSACETSLSENTAWKRETIFFSNSDDLFYAGDATKKAVDLFFGAPTNGQPTNGQPTNGQPTNGQPTTGTANSFFDRENTAINRISGYQTGVKSRLVSPLAPRLSLTVSGAASIGETTLLLPDGAGILVEPITIRFNSLMGEAQIGLRQNLPITERVAAAVSANVGLKAAISTTRINSPVIAIQNNASFADPFIGAGIEISASPTNHTTVGALSLGVELRYYRTTGNTISAEIGLKF